MNHPPISRRTLTRAGAWSAPLILAGSQVPLYAASSSSSNPEETAVNPRWGLYSQILGRELDSDSPLLGVSQRLGGVSATSGSHNYQPALQRPHDPDLTSVAAGAGTFTPGGSLGGAQSGSYGGSGFWFSAPRNLWGETIGGSSILPAGSRFQADYTIIFPQGQTPDLPEGVSPGKQIIPKQEARPGLTTNSATLEAEIDQAIVTGDLLSFTVTYISLEEAQASKDSAPYAQLNFSQPEILFPQATGMDFSLSLTVLEGIIYSQGPQGPEIGLGLMGSYINNGLALT